MDKRRERPELRKMYPDLTILRVQERAAGTLTNKDLRVVAMHIAKGLGKHSRKQNKVIAYQKSIKSYWGGSRCQVRDKSLPSEGSHRGKMLCLSAQQLLFSFSLSQLIPSRGTGSIFYTLNPLKVLLWITK